MAEMARANSVIQNSEAQAIASSAAGVPIRYDQPWLGSLLRPVLIGLMVACIDWVVLSFVARVAPFLTYTYVPVMVILSLAAAITGCITTTLLAQPDQRHRRTFGYRLAELGLILALTRLAIWAVTGQWPAPMLFLTQPLGALLDDLFVVGAVIVAFSWMLATSTTDDLLRMALQPDELFAIEADRIGELVRTSYSDRPAILRGLVTRWVVGGIVLVIFAAGLGLNFTSGRTLFTMTQSAVGPSVVAAIVIYFLAGLVLISHGQLAILRSRWTIDRVPSAAAVLRNWPFYALLLLIVIGILAALLPFGGTFRLAQVIGYTVTFLFGLILDFFRLLMMLFLLLVSLLTGEAPPAAEEPPPPAPPPVMPEVPPQVNNFPDWAGGAVFWVFMAILLGYAAYIYFSGKGFRFGWLTALWRMLLARWRLMRGAYQTWVHTRLPSLRRDDDTTSGSGRIPLSRWRLGNLDSEQRVRYFYLTTVERAQESGLPRNAAETPRQYAPRLSERLATQPEDGEAVQTLTEAFVRVRYSRGKFESTEVSTLQRLWEQIRQHLRL
jgi:hypothetical protein